MLILQDRFFQSHGTWQGMPATLGLRKSRRTHLGEDQPAAEDHQDRQNGALAQPWERALLGEQPILLLLVQLRSHLWEQEALAPCFKLSDYRSCSCAFGTIGISESVVERQKKWNFAGQFFEFQVGRKGSADHLNRGLDSDVIVAEVRATSHKPDEIYGIIERLSPGTRKIELFGRPHNVQPNWWVVHENQ